MVYLTMLSRAYITQSAYGVLPLGHYLNVCILVTWRAMLLCWVHKLLTGSPKPDRSNVKGQMVPHVAGRGRVKHGLITSPYKTIWTNRHNNCCHIENFEMAKKRVIRAMSCVLLLGMC
jgi:hypothetical protein